MGFSMGDDLPCFCGSVLPAEDVGRDGFVEGDCCAIGTGGRCEALLASTRLCSSETANVWVICTRFRRTKSLVL